MAKLNLTKSQARKIILHAAGLTKPAQFGKGKQAVYKLIDHLGFLQIDTKLMVTKICHAIKDFAKLNQCEEIVVVKSNDKKMLKTMREALA
jgi:uncharacterized protein YcaQ